MSSVCGFLCGSVIASSSTSSRVGTQPVKMEEKPRQLTFVCGLESQCEYKVQGDMKDDAS